MKCKTCGINYICCTSRDTDPFNHWIYCSYDCYKKDKEDEITKFIKNIWFDICVLERDYGIEYDGYMTQILKFTIQCIADKYKINLGLRKD